MATVRVRREYIKRITPKVLKVLKEEPDLTFGVICLRFGISESTLRKIRNESEKEIS